MCNRLGEKPLLLGFSIPSHKVPMILHPLYGVRFGKENEEEGDPMIMEETTTHTAMAAPITFSC
jgi:hypothetical protein